MGLLCDIVCVSVQRSVTAYGHSQVLCLLPLGQLLIVDEVVRSNGPLFIGDADNFALHRNDR